MIRRATLVPGTPRAASAGSVLGLPLLVVALATGCGPAPTPTTPPSATPTPVPGSSSSADGPDLCHMDRVDLVAGTWGGAAGTNYLNLTARLIGDALCAVHAWPAVQVTDATGRVIAASDPSDPVSAAQLIALGPPLDYHLGWASWCGAAPVRPFHAWIGFVSANEPTEIELPAGFGPSDCMGGAPSVVFVEPAFEP